MRVVVRVAPLIALLAFVAELSLRPMAESDLFFRIKAGQEILREHGLPGRNLFSFTYPDHPDIDAAWLFEVAAAALHARGGFPAVVVAKTVVLLAAFAAAFWLCRRRGAGAVASALALAAAAYVGRERFVERPHIFSLLGAVGLLAAIDALVAPRHRRGVRPSLKGSCRPALRAGAADGQRRPARRARRDRVRGRRAVGQPACGRVRGAAGAGVRRRGRAAGWNRRGPASRAGGAGRGGRCRSPRRSASGLFRYLRLHLTLPALHPVDEFRAPSWLSDPALFVYRAGLVVVGGRRLARAVRAWTSLLPALVFAGLAVRSVRFAADVALVTAPLLAVGAHGVADRLRARWPRLLPEPIPSVGVVALLVGLAVGPRVAAGGRPAGSISTRASCRCPRSRSSTRTACAIACTTTSRPGRTCCSIPPAATPATVCSSIRGCPPIRPSSTACSAAPT